MITIENAVTTVEETEGVVADNAVTIEAETDAEAAEDNAVTTEVETDAEAAEDTEVVEIAVTTEVETEGAAEDNAVTTEVETDAEVGLEEKAKAGISGIHVISDLTQIAPLAENTREAMTESRNVVIQEALVDGVRKARVEAVVGEI